MLLVFAGFACRRAEDPPAAEHDHPAGSIGATVPRPPGPVPPEFAAAPIIPPEALEAYFAPRLSNTGPRTGGGEMHVLPGRRFHRAEFSSVKFRYPVERDGRAVGSFKVSFRDYGKKPYVSKPLEEKSFEDERRIRRSHTEGDRNIVLAIQKGDNGKLTIDNHRVTASVQYASVEPGGPPITEELLRNAFIESGAFALLDLPLSTGRNAPLGPSASPEVEGDPEVEEDPDPGMDPVAGEPG